MSGRPVVVNGNHRINIFFTKSTYHVIDTLLHFGIGTLHGIQFNAAAITSGIDRRHRTSAQANAVVVAAHNHDFVSCLRMTFLAITLRAVAYATSQHNYLVVAIFGIIGCFLMFKSQHRTADKRLAKLITKVAGTVRCLDKYLFGRLVEPFAHRQYFLPRTSFLHTGIGSHVDSRSGNGPRSFASPHTVADFSARTC